MAAKPKPKTKPTRLPAVHRNQGLASWEAPWPSATSHWIAADPPPLRLTCAVRAQTRQAPQACPPTTAAKAGRVFYLDALARCPFV
ncbi:hypothetical protein J3F84DRAFT_363729 [Trichoderma pleuroticola]